MNGPKFWQKLLDGSPKGAVLMGGAIVDYVVGVEPKDYDIFYTYKPGLIVPKDWQLEDVDFNDADWLAKHNEEYLQGIDQNGNKPISSVIEYLVDGQRVQMVGVNYANPRKHFLNFDHSLTLAYFSDRGLFVHRKVLESTDSRTITYVSRNKDPKARAKSLARAQKKAARYGGDWKFEGFE